MGKWTGEYYDDVLGAKIKSLVAGAVKRSKLDKAEPSISYESFVEDLDPGDSFTTMLTELLVKEMADRRNRQATADRRLIADHTAKGLRLLATPARVYRDRSVRGLLGRRSSLNLTDYLTAPPDEMDLDSETDASLESLLDPEGARLNNELHDAYASPPYGTSGARIRPPFPPPVSPASRALPVATEHAAPYNSRSRQFAARAYRAQQAQASAAREDWTSAAAPWSMPWPPAPPGPASVSLARQPSIRRPPARSRTVDFNDFTTRRRSSTREEPSPAPAGATATSTSSVPTTMVPPRRFFPPMRRLELPWGSYPEASSTSSSTTETAVPAAEPAAAGEHEHEHDRTSRYSWLPPPPAPHSHSPPQSPEMSPPPPPPPSVPTPRLRRGGVRPPEAMLSWHVSMLSSSRRERESAEDGEAETVPDGSQSPPPPQPRVPYELRGLSPGVDE